MPPRRSHKKSRTGCQRCKKRKIKCDEARPRCNKCLQHGVRCDFEDPGVVLEIATPAAYYTPLSSLSPSSRSWSKNNSEPLSAYLGPSANASAYQTPPADSRDSEGFNLRFDLPFLYSRPLSSICKIGVDRLTELRLWHHFSLSAFHNTQLSSIPIKSPWLYDMHNLGFSRRPYLADAILAVAASHLQRQLAEDSDVSIACTSYSARAHREQMYALQSGNTTEESEAIFFTSCLLTLCTLAGCPVPPHNLSCPDEISQSRLRADNCLPLAWLRAFQDTKSIVSWLGKPLFNGHVVKKIIESESEFHYSENCIEEESLSSSFFGHLLEGLSDEYHHNSISVQVYRQAVAILNWIHAHPFPSSVLAFPALVSSHFVDHVAEKRPRALVILACFVGLMKRIEPIWWMCTTVNDEVLRLVSLFDHGSKWWWHLEWPIRIALLGNDPIPPAIWGSESCNRLQVGENLGDSLTSYIEVLVKALAGNSLSSCDRSL